MTLTNSNPLAQARELVARALALVIEADATLAAAELEQALDTISRQCGDATINSAASEDDQPDTE